MLNLLTQGALELIQYSEVFLYSLYSRYMLANTRYNRERGGVDPNTTTTKKTDILSMRCREGDGLLPGRPAAVHRDPARCLCGRARNCDPQVSTVVLIQREFGRQRTRRWPPNYHYMALCVYACQLMKDGWRGGLGREFKVYATDNS